MIAHNDADRRLSRETGGAIALSVSTYLPAPKKMTSSIEEKPACSQDGAASCCNVWWAQSISPIARGKDCQQALGIVVQNERGQTLRQRQPKIDETPGRDLPSVAPGLRRENSNRAPQQSSLGRKSTLHQPTLHYYSFIMPADHRNINAQ